MLAVVSTFLLTWNPAYGGLDEATISRNIEATAACRRAPGRWNTGGTTRKIQPGDRVFLLVLGAGDHGIFASGFVTSEVYKDVRWNDSSRLANYVDLEWDAFLDPTDALPGELLQTVFPANRWRPRSSGTQIVQGREDELEHMWAEHLDDVRAGQAQLQSSPSSASA